jgi:hypothetical protein
MLNLVSHLDRRTWPRIFELKRKERGGGWSEKIVELILYSDSSLTG